MARTLRLTAVRTVWYRGGGEAGGVPLLPVIMACTAGGTEKRGADRFPHPFLPRVGNRPYSYRRASMGFRRLALRAGYHPKNTPVTVHTANDMKMAKPLKMNG